ncbi:WW domain-containing oxidoreductase [Colletotrichum siamense]|nr:WW domain-containing oxidoreductase [Colletotrichum siamense]
MARYIAAHQNPQGPGDSRPTALQIIEDEGLAGDGLSGKTALVTGANRGIGLETARALHAAGATVYLGVRDLVSGREAIEDIVGTSNPDSGARLQLLEMSLESLASVCNAAQTFLSKTNNKINILALNAGVMACPKSSTIDGFQFVNHKKSENDGQFDEYSVPGLLVSPDLLIRDLDFVDGRNEFNEDMPGLRPRFFNEDEPSLRPKYSYTSLHKGNCLVREHQIGAKKGVLSIHVLGKQDSFQFASSSSGESSLPVPQYDNPFTIQKKAAITWNPRHNTPRDECIDIILAYKLDCDSNDEAQPPLWELASNTMNSLLQADVGHSLTDGSDPTLDFFLWRNLEHILCVCSIPTTEGDGDNLPCISLTCGDVDGHRVAAAASFYAFRTLMLGLEHFGRKHEPCNCHEDPFGKTTGPYICTMLRRIRRVCGGHVKWLFQKERPRGGPFCPNYWVNGDEIAGWQNNPNLAQKSLVNAPFHIIKACTFIKMVGRESFPWPVKNLQKAIKAWVKDLDRRNKLRLYAFPRYDKEQTESFYLADHALIWQAIKSAEMIGLDTTFNGSGPANVYSSKTLQRNIIKRFTTENPQSKKRMIALPRARMDYSMKYVQPFNNIVDDKNIVELQDEWLYNKPSFFITKPLADDENESTIDEGEAVNQSLLEIDRATVTFAGFMIDVPKTKPMEKNRMKGSESPLVMRGIVPGRNVNNLMGEERTIEKSKKRFWAFFAANPSGNLACLNTIFPAEKKDLQMKSFLERHMNYRRLFTEETVAVLNIWTTELHLSFYRLGTGTAVDNHISDNSKGVEGAGESYEEEIPTLPAPGKGGQRKRLAKVAMGFQFEGDFFDRYWTCRLLDADSQEPDERHNMSPDGQDDRTSAELGHQISADVDSSSPGLITSLWEEMMSFPSNGRGNSLGKSSWQQRRVLELILFGKMLERMNHGANEVLNQAWLSLRDKTKIQQETEYDMFLITRDTFVISRKRIEDVQRVLRTLMGNLEENIEQIALWQSREQDRQAERPRWTFHDENRFRVSIQKLVVSNDHDVLKLKRVSLKISKLEESLAKKLEILRSDREEQRGGETQLFTYVTVVFLPLGFATGIFSMSEAPATQTVIGMIITAVAAFTVVALLGMFVKTIISAEVVHLPEVTNWTSQDWSKWKDGVQSHWKSKENKVQHEDTLSSVTDKPEHTKTWVRRVFQRKASSDDTKEQKPADGEDVERRVKVEDFPRPRDIFRRQMTL